MYIHVLSQVCCYLRLGKMRWTSFEQTWIPLTQSCFVSGWLKLAQWKRKSNKKIKTTKTQTTTTTDNGKKVPWAFSSGKLGILHCCQIFCLMIYANKMFSKISSWFLLHELVIFITYCLFCMIELCLQFYMLMYRLSEYYNKLHVNCLLLVYFSMVSCPVYKL